jgi:hypothetical protein
MCLVAHIPSAGCQGHVIRWLHDVCVVARRLLKAIPERHVGTAESAVF